MQEQAGEQALELLRVDGTDNFGSSDAVLLDQGFLLRARAVLERASSRTLGPRLGELRK